MSLKGPEHMIWMLPTQLDQPVAVGTKLEPLGPSKDLQGPLRTPRAPQKGLFGPLGLLIWSQSGPKCHIIMCYTRGKCFRVILGLSWDVAPFLPVGM